MNLPPFSIYITVRKSFSNKKTSPKPVLLSSFDEDVNSETQISVLENKLKEEKENLSLQHDLEDALEDSEANYLKISFLESKIIESENGKEEADKIDLREAVKK